MRKRRINNMVMKIKDIRKLTSEQRKSRLDQYRREYMNVKAQLSSGGSIDDPGKISELKRTIARLLTIQKEEEQNK